MDRDGKEDCAIVLGMDRGFSDRRVSDHWQVCAELDVERDGGGGRPNGGRRRIELGIAGDFGREADAQSYSETDPRDRAAGKTGSRPGWLSGPRFMYG